MGRVYFAELGIDMARFEKKKKKKKRKPLFTLSLNTFSKFNSFKISKI